MKQTEAVKVGDLLRLMMESGNDSEEFLRQKASFMWSEVVGPVINKATIRRYVDGDTLHVFIDSAPLKSELSFVTHNIVDKINEAVGKNILRKLIIH